MVRPREVGPDLPSGLRRPDRSVSLRDPRELPVQTMGLGQGGAPGKFGGGYGVHTRISELGGEYRVRLFIDGEYQAGADYFADDIEEATETAKAMEEDARLSDKTSDVARGEARDFVEDAIMRPDLDEVVVPEDLVADDARLPVEEMRGLTADEAFQMHQATAGVGAMAGAGAMAGMNVAQARLVDPFRPNVLDPSQLPPQGPVRDPGMGTALEPGPDRELDPYHDIDIIEELDAQGIDWEGLTHGDPAVEAAKAAVAGMSAAVGAGQEALNLGDKTGRRLPRATQVAGQAGVETAKGILEGIVPPPPDEVVQPLGAPPVQDTLFMGGGDRNPELRSMDSQMLTDMMAQQATQPEQGWLGGALGGVGGFLGGTLSQMQGTTTLPYAQQAQAQMSAFQNMSTEQKLAIVLTGLAYAAATSGMGSPLAPPLLGGAALLNATG